MTKDRSDEPKIVHTEVEEIDGFWNKYRATAVADNGEVAEGYGSSKEAALNSATYKALRS